jgi:hypothetical protein
MVVLWEEELPERLGHYSVKSEIIPLHHVAGHSGDDGNWFKRNWLGARHGRVSLMMRGGLGKSDFLAISYPKFKDLKIMPQKSLKSG